MEPHGRQEQNVTSGQHDLQTRGVTKLWDLGRVRPVQLTVSRGHATLHHVQLVALVGVVENVAFPATHHGDEVAAAVVMRLCNDGWHTKPTVNASLLLLVLDEEGGIRREHAQITAYELHPSHTHTSKCIPS